MCTTPFTFLSCLCMCEGGIVLMHVSRHLFFLDGLVLEYVLIFHWEREHLKCLEKTPIVVEYRWYPGKGTLERTYRTWVTHSRRIGPRMEMTVEQLLASLRGQAG